MWASRPGISALGLAQTVLYAEAMIHSERNGYSFHGAETLGEPPSRGPHHASRATEFHSVVAPPLLGSVPPRVNTALASDKGAMGSAWAARYRATGLLGEGGMGVVRLCKDVRIGRDVAMKVVRDDHVGDDTRQRFLREARVQGQLEHPSIVPVYDVGVSPDGASYFTMKRIRGVTLGQILDERRAPAQCMGREYSLRKLLTIFSGVCLAVHFAHTRGVVHRDLKPANVMLGDFGEVYVLDWGIAKLLGAERAVTTQLPMAGEAGVTQDGVAMGTPGFMSPEQMRGELDAIGPRSDVYALGAILFEILTLQDLHQGKSVDELLRSTLRGVRSRPSQVAPDHNIAPELDAICARATALRKEDRYTSARELSDAVSAYLDGDRDVRLHAEVAVRHTDAAERAAARSRDGGCTASQDRRIALTELGRAIALDPANERAQSILLSLLDAPPKEQPSEAVDQVVTTSSTAQAVAFRTSALALLLWGALSAAFFAWMGIRNMGAVAAYSLLWFGTGAVGLAISRGKTPSVSAKIGFISLLTIAVASTSLITGPFVLGPAAAVRFTLLLMLSPERSVRRYAAVAGVCAFLIPAALALLGLIPSIAEFQQGAIVFHPYAVELPKVPTALFLIVGHLILLSASLVISRGRRAGAAVYGRAPEAQLILNAWQVRQATPPSGTSHFPPKMSN